MKKFRFGLLSRIVLAIILGIALGNFSPAVVVRVFNTFSALFDQLIKFIVPLIIIGFLTPAIAETGKGAGRLLLLTVAIAYASTLVSGFLGYGIANAAFPSCVDPSLAAAANAAALEFPPFFKVSIPPLVDVMSALVFAFMAGLGIVATHADVLKRAASEFRALVEKAVSGMIVPLLPVYIFAIFLDMTAAGKAAVVIRTFAAVITITFVLTLLLLLLQYTIAASIAKCNPLKKLWTMFPAYMTAMGTSSSAATIPVTLRQTLANGVKPETANFVIPLCATVHLAGSMIKLVCFTVAIQLLAGRPIELSAFSGFIALTGVTMVAAPGVPGGAVMAAVGLISSFFGFTPAEQGLIIALYVSTDGFGTACNITGDGAIALVVDKFSSKIAQ
ncbi:MAG: dicarboxylate/amino acid:cation symporter [Kiritimatiellae bacterium]|nr:dicarboxylate/amino acid:cation symporter [Kiritimatiellia bacterium]